MVLKELNKFIKSNYNNQDVLISPVFYNSEVAIRFEINDPSVKEIYNKAIILFEEIFNSTNKILLVINTYNKNEVQIEEMLKNYLKPKNLKIDQEHIEKDDIILTRYCLECKLKDINYKKMIPAICNSDLKVKPCIDDHIFFINKDINVIYHLYDDRVLDIISNNKNSVISLYEKYNDLILDYNRELIN